MPTNRRTLPETDDRLAAITEMASVHRRSEANASAVAAIAAEFSVKPIDNDPEYARLLKIAANIQAGIERREDMLTVLALEGELEGQQDTPAITTTLWSHVDPDNKRSAKSPVQMVKTDRHHALRERLAALRAKHAVKQPEADVVAAALQLAEGVPLEEHKSRAERRKALSRELDALRKGLAPARRAVEERREVLSHQVAVEQVPTRNKLMAEYWLHLEALTNAVAEINRQDGAVAASGYQQRPDVLHRPSVRGVLTSGNTSQVDSPVSHERRRLETLGII